VAKYYIYISWYINLLEPLKINNFLRRLRIQIRVFLNFGLYLWSDQFQFMALFMVFKFVDWPRLYF